MNNKNMLSENNRKLYKILSCANHQLRSKNAIYISPSNSIKHELAKTIGGYLLRKWGDIPFYNPELLNLLYKIEVCVNDLMKGFPKDKSDFITEAVPINEPLRRVDLVRLSDDQRFEFETDKKVKKENCCTIYLK